MHAFRTYVFANRLQRGLSAIAELLVNHILTVDVVTKLPSPVGF